MILLGPGRVHAHRYLLRSGQLRTEHRCLTEYRNPALTHLQDRSLTPPFDRNLGRIGRDSRRLGRLNRYGVRTKHEDRDRVFWQLERRTGKGHHLCYLLVLPPATRDGTFLETGPSLQDVRLARLPMPEPRVAVAVLHPEGLGKFTGCPGKRHVISNQEERSALFDPRSDGGDLIRREGGWSWKRPIFGVSLVERIDDHEDINCLERGRRERLLQTVDAVTVAPQELGERFVAPLRRMKVIMRLVDRDAGTRARFIGRSADGRVVLQVWFLLC
jgi:hypothetical protein